MDRCYPGPQDGLRNAARTSPVYYGPLYLAEEHGRIVFESYRAVRLMRLERDAQLVEHGGMPRLICLGRVGRGELPTF